MKTILDLLPEYVDYLQHERRLSARTLIGYVSDLRQLAAFIDKAVDEITVDDLRAYMREMSRAGRTTTTIQRRMNGFSTFWHWLVLSHYVPEVIPTKLRLPKKPRHTPKWLNEQELLQFLSKPGASVGEDTAWKLLVYLGFRRTEVLNLRWEDVNLIDRTLIIRNAKGLQDRMLFIPSPLLKYLQSVTRTSDYVCPNRHGQQWNEWGFHRAFQRHLENVGLGNRGIKSHTLRHSFATHLVKRGVHISTVKELLGHRDISSTMIYIHHDPNILRDAIEKFSLNKETE